jgi:WD40 repeat protein
MSTHACSARMACISLAFAVGCSPGSKRLELTGHDAEVPKVAISPDGSTAATLSGNTVKLWGTSNGSEKASFETFATDLAFSPDGKSLATGFGKMVILWDAESGEKDRELRLEPEEDPSNGDSAEDSREKKEIRWRVQHVAFSPDGKKLAGASGPSTSDQGVAIWDLGSEAASPESFLQAAGCVAFSPDGKILAVGGRSILNREGGTGGSVSLYDVEKGESIAVCRAGKNTLAHPHGTTACLAFSPKGDLLASGGSDTQALIEGTPGLNKSRSAVRLWEVPSGKLVATYEGAMKQHLSLAFTPDGNTLLVAGGNPFTTMKTGTIRMYDVAKRSEKQTLVDMKYQIQSMALAANGKTLILASNNVGGNRDREVMQKILHRQKGVGAPKPAASSKKYKDTFVEIWSLK